MPLTPYHFGPHALIALPLGRRIDLPVFVLANVAVDLEPLVVMSLGLEAPLHGYVHTLSLGSLVGALFALLCYRWRDLFSHLMGLVRLPYRASLRTMLLSGVLGVWVHILTDAPLYGDIRPFFPWAENPLYGLVPPDRIYLLCSLSFPLAIGAYILRLTLDGRRGRGPS